MNWILAFNLDFADPKPMSNDEAEKAVQELASKASRQFTKGKTAYKELNEALSSSYADAVAALTNPSSQSAEAQRIVYGIIADETSVFGSSVPQDQIVNIKKAVINKVKADYSLPVYKFLDGPDKEATEARITEIISLGIEAAGAHVAGEDEQNGYSAAEAKDRYNSFQNTFESADKEYVQINKSLSKLGMSNLYALIGNGDEVSAMSLPYTILQSRLNSLEGEFESGAEIENLKHLAADVFANEMNRAKYDNYLDLYAKEDILKNLEKRSSNGTVNSKLFMESAVRFDALFSDADEALLILYGFADSKGLDTGTDYVVMESFLAMKREGSSNAHDNAAPSPSPEFAYQENPYTSNSSYQDSSSYETYDSPQRSEEWKTKSPEYYTAEDFSDAFEAFQKWQEKRNDPPKQPKPNANLNKSKWVAGFLAIFLGWIGAQKFYLGHNAAGIITIVITTLGAVVLVGPLITSVIGIVEGIKYLTESPEQFKDTYLIGGKTWF